MKSTGKKLPDSKPVSKCNLGAIVVSERNLPKGKHADFFSQVCVLANV